MNTSELIQAYLNTIKVQPERTYSLADRKVFEFHDYGYANDQQFLFRVSAFEQGVQTQMVYPYRINLNQEAEYKAILQQMNRWNAQKTELRTYLINCENNNTKNRTGYFCLDYFVPISENTSERDFINFMLEAAEKPNRLMAEVNILQRRRAVDPITIAESENENSKIVPIDYAVHPGMLEAIDLNILFGEIAARGDFAAVDNMAGADGSRFLRITDGGNEHFLFLTEEKGDNCLIIQTFLDILRNENPVLFDQAEYKNLSFCSGWNKSSASAVKVAVVREQGRAVFLAMTPIPIFRNRMSRQTFWDALNCHLGNTEHLAMVANKF